MGISRQSLFGKLDSTLFKSIESATVFCKLRGNSCVELVHWLHQWVAVADGDLQRLLRHLHVDMPRLEADLSAALMDLPSGASSVSNLSPLVELAVERAWLIASLSYGDRRIRGGHLLAALVDTVELRRAMFAISPVFRKLLHEDLADALDVVMADSPETEEVAHDDPGFDVRAEPGEASRAIAPAVPGGSSLARYATDLTQRARDRQIDPVVGRDHEIRTMVDVLLRRRQNNPLLTGEAGVGKTAVVEGLALAIAEQRVPPALQRARLLSLDVGALLAGASMKGEFESRLKAVLHECESSVDPVILFIDEIHGLVGAGGSVGTGDAANLLKPALARGVLRTVGATTWSEYKRHIEKDPALTRRFQVLQVAEPDESAAIDMVRGVVSIFEQHHGVIVTEEAVRAAVTLSHRYIPARQLPDKAISLLDTACARVALSRYAPPGHIQHLRQRLQALQVELQLAEREAAMGKGAERVAGLRRQIDQLDGELNHGELRWESERVAAAALLEGRHEAMNAFDASTSTVIEPGRAKQLERLESQLCSIRGDVPMVHVEVGEAVVSGIVSDWTGIPLGRMVRDDFDNVLQLDDRLSNRVIGQAPALAAIARRLQVAKAGLLDPRKPVGVFLLVGPSGVGKTETALALSEALYGGEQNVIKINMSEFQEPHTVSTLKGAPPGYVGYGEGGVLTEAVRRRPYSVVLLDEVEKAHRDVHEIFFQVFDKGEMEDGEGRYIDFRNTTILLTSNVGAEDIAQLCADPALIPTPEALREALEPELLRFFPAAFLGRLCVVPFLPLASDALDAVTRLHLDQVVRRMHLQHGVELRYSDAVVRHIASRSAVQQTGARTLISQIEQHVLPALGREWLLAFRSRLDLSSIDIDVREGSLSFATEPAAPDESSPMSTTN